MGQSDSDHDRAKIALHSKNEVYPEIREEGMKIDIFYLLKGKLYDIFDIQGCSILDGAPLKLS